MKIKSNAQWKSIPLSHGFFTNLESASAVCGGIEELSDYTLVTKAMMMHLYNGEKGRFGNVKMVRF